jgi:hypothetical protein
MRRPVVVAALSLAALLLVAGTAFGTDPLVYRQLSGVLPNTSLRSVGPQVVSGDRVVWVANEGAPTTQLDPLLLTITFAETSPSVLMTVGPEEEMQASVSGDKVAVLRTATWSGRGDVWLIDAISGVKQKLTSTRATRMPPVISDHWVVWADLPSIGNGQPTQWVAYDLRSRITTTVPCEPGPTMIPSLDGDLLAWEEGPAVVVWDLSAGHQVWSSPSDARAVLGPDVSGSLVTFAATDTVGWPYYPSYYYNYPYGYPYYYQVSSGYVGGYYYGAYRGADVFVANVSTGETARVPMGGGPITGAPAVSDGTVYWPTWTSTGARIMSSVVSGSVASSPTVVFDSLLSSIGQIDASGGHLVWTQYGYNGYQLVGSFEGTTSALTLHADRHSLPYGSSVHLSMTGAGLADGTPVALESSSRGSSAWTSRGLLHVTGSAASTSVAVLETTSFRVRCLGAPGLGESTSTAVRVVARASVTAPTAPKKPRSRVAMALTGRVAPSFYPWQSSPAMYVYVERRTGGTWHRIARIKAFRTTYVYPMTKSQVYRSTFTPARSGSYRARAYVPTTVANSAAWSSWKPFTVR